MTSWEKVDKTLIFTSSVENEQILIEGIGGIGGLVAGLMIKQGYRVDLVTGNPEITDVINTNGIKLTINNSTEIIQATAKTSLDEIPPDTKYTAILLIMKADSVIEAAKASELYLEEETGFMATFQNGIVEEELNQVVSGNKIVPVTVGFGSTMLTKGVYVKTSPGGFHIGELKGKPTLRVQRLKEMLSSVDEVIVSDNMLGVLWSKLAINCTINTLGAITGKTLGELLQTRQIRDLFLKIYSEVVEVAHSKDITLVKIAADPYRLYLPKNAGSIKRFTKDLIVRIVGRKYKNLRSSTLQSIERGRKSEIKYLNGYVVSEAEKLGIDVPANRVLTNIMNRIDDGDLTYKEENLELIMEGLENNK